MAVERTTIRRARKDRPCGDYVCSGDQVIRAGDLYNQHVTSPGSYDWGEVSTWSRLDECGMCAKVRTGEPITRENVNA
jgi:hypothetical protein